MRISVTGLQLRNNTFHFRRAVPADLVEIVGQREWKKSLNLKEHQKVAAAAQADALWKETDRHIATLRSDREHDVSPLQLHTAAGRWAAEHGLLEGQPGRQDFTETHQGRTYHFESDADLTMDLIIEDAGREFGLDKDGRPRQFSPMQEARLATLRAGAPVRPEMRISDALEAYTREHLGGEMDKATKQSTQQFISMMGDLEVSTIRRPIVIDWLNRLVTERRQGEGTVKRRLAVMKAVINHLIKNHDYEISNPFRDQRVPKSAKGAETRAPFHRRHSDLIDLHLAAPDMDRDIRNVCILLKHTGCRPMEIGGLTKSEVFLDAEIPFLRLQATAGRSLKNKLAARTIPLLGEAVAAAEDAVSAASGDYLFPPDFQKTDRLSQRLKNTIRTAGVPKSPRLTAYSFRHSVIDGMKAAGVSDQVRRDIVGHADRSAQRHYGSDARPLRELKEGLQAGLDRLGDVDEAQYRAGELPPA